MNARVFDSPGDLIAAAASSIVQTATGKESFSIALSGGSTPQPLYQMLGQPPYCDVLDKVKITWVVVDERCVPFDDPQSNAGMITRTLFADGMPASHRFLPFRTELSDPALIAARFEEEWHSLSVGDLDLVLLGMGDDGHTASLFPGTTALGVRDRIATEVFVPRLDVWRVTITRPVIEAAKQRLVLATGAGKQPVLKAMREGTEFPITQVTEGLDTWWFVDRAAWPG